MDPQLHQLVSILESGEIGYWVDSGSLLGIVREGHLLEHDPDIDISIWASDLDKFLEVIDLIKISYGILKIHKFKGMVYEIKMAPPPQFRRSVDIKVFRETDGYAWCPLPLNTNQYTRDELRSLVSSQRLKDILDRVTWMAFRKTHRLLLSVCSQMNGLWTVDFGKPPWSKGRQMLTWRFPASLVGATTIHATYGIRVPDQTQEYLKYRYGNWREPAQDWYYARDDGAISTELYA